MYMSVGCYLLLYVEVQPFCTCCNNDCSKNGCFEEFFFFFFKPHTDTWSFWRETLKMYFSVQWGSLCCRCTFLHVPNHVCSTLFLNKSGTLCGRARPFISPNPSLTTTPTPPAPLLSFLASGLHAASIGCNHRPTTVDSHHHFPFVMCTPWNVSLSL